ncbi:hypothetical protein ACMU_16810 [Actibacterium mucosum KCTC 23349]|uniref:Pyrrolo-quinoline quinone repeat domain-containing protein n=1 Tax=Actibacterium mucosum KCTC 23349 TaxID=1454373 RepID=A0A037ZIX1_9RHOB|nr:sulfotransferase [Actibacterium mucosum]KAJ54775.1 hypothetical protein ACMU_16810 [Actibacterium mucosum KCTC 23349]
MVASVFLLGPGRAFTSVLSAVIGQHPQLYGVPETNLSIADTVGEWLQMTGGNYRPFLRAGLVRAIAQLETGAQTNASAFQAEQWLFNNQSMTTAALFAMLEASVSPRGIVEKSPMTVTEPRYLNNLLSLAPDARFIHVTRHPYSNCSSMVNTEWFRIGLEASRPECWDARGGGDPVFDPQFHWLQSHQYILDFEKNVAPDRWLRVRGEDILENPQEVLPGICQWLGIDDGPDAVTEMRHPEESPFACYGPTNALGGNDSNFLEAPMLRPYRAPKSPLNGPLPWRSDAGEFVPEVRELAESFGYRHEDLPAKPPTTTDTRTLVGIEPDGKGCPMAHSNLMDDSLCELPPLRTLSEVKHVPYPSRGGINFSGYTGEKYAICVYESAREPALVAFDVNTGRKIWQTKREILDQPKDSTAPGRWISGLLLVNLVFDDGSRDRRVYAANADEMVCLDENGKTIWRRPTAEMAGEAADTKIGGARCLRYSKDNKIVFVTHQGVLCKIDPVDGSTVDVYPIRDLLMVDGQPQMAGYKVMQSIVLVDDTLYMQGALTADHTTEKTMDPVRLMRVQVSGNGDDKSARLTETDVTGASSDRYQFGVVGDGRQGGSASAILREDGTPVILVNGNTPEGGFAVTGVADKDGKLQPQWHMDIPDRESPEMVAAPAIDPVTGLFFCASKGNMFVVRDAANRSGQIKADLTCPPITLLDPFFMKRATSAEISSPITLARDPETQGLVAYISMSLQIAGSTEPHAVLTALHVDLTETKLSVTPLWTGPLALDSNGDFAPATRSFAQPALFQYMAGKEPRTGIVMGTYQSGVTFFR